MEVILKIEGKRVDLFQDEGMTLIRSVANVRDLTKLISDYSKGFTIPASPRNNEIFEYYYDIDVVGNFNAHYKVDAVLEGLGLRDINGSVELHSVNMNRGKPDSYMISFYGAIKQLSETFGDTQMNEIDWSYFDHTLNYGIVSSTWSKLLLSGDIVYPIIDHQRGWFYSTDAAYSTDIRNIAVASGGIRMTELKPAFRLSKLIFDNFGLRAESSKQKRRVK